MLDYSEMITITGSLVALIRFAICSLYFISREPCLVSSPRLQIINVLSKSVFSVLHISWEKGQDLAKIMVMQHKLATVQLSFSAGCRVWKGKWSSETRTIPSAASLHNGVLSYRFLRRISADQFVLPSLVLHNLWLDGDFPIRKSKLWIQYINRSEIPCIACKTLPSFS